jgi:hypothetical protein
MTFSSVGSDSYIRHGFPSTFVMATPGSLMCAEFNPFRSYVGPPPTLWFSCSRRFSWSLTLSKPIFLPPAYTPALIYFVRQRGWWITCNYPSVLKETSIKRNRKSTTCAICWLNSVLQDTRIITSNRSFNFPPRINKSWGVWGWELYWIEKG